MEDQGLYENAPAALNQPPPATRKYKILKSFIVSNVFTFMGLCSAILTPAIDDIRRQVGCNFEQYAQALVVSQIGSIVGSLGGGVLADRFQKHIDLLLGVEMLIGAVGRAVLPWTTNLITLSLSLTVTSFALSASNPASNAHLIVIWGADASSPMQLLHMGYGIGTILSPLILAPYLSKPINSTHERNITDSMDMELNKPESSSFYLSYEQVGAAFYAPHVPVVDDNSTVYSESRIKIPFYIISAYGAISGLVFLLFYFIPNDMSRGQRARVKEKKTAGKIFNPGECAGGRVLYGFTMIILLCLLYILNTGKDNSVSLFMYAVAVDTSLGFSIIQGSLLATGYYAGYAGGRAVYSFLGLCFPVQALLLSEVVGMLAVHICLPLLALDSAVNYWVLVCLSGFFAGPLVPTMMTWMDRYIEMTALAFASLCVGMSLGGFIFNWLSGYIFQNMQPVDLYRVSLICGVTMTVLIAIGQILGLIHGDRYKAMKLQEEQNAQESNGMIHDENSSGYNVNDTDHLIQ